jgi:hypothetical protein
VAEVICDGSVIYRHETSNGTHSSLYLQGPLLVLCTGAPRGETGNVSGSSSTIGEPINLLVKSKSLISA